MRHLEINTGWQALNFVVGRREIVGPFIVRPVTDNPLSSGAELERFLRYAAGVELTVAQEYLTAAYSTAPPGRTFSTSGRRRPRFACGADAHCNWRDAPSACRE